MTYSELRRMVEVWTANSDPEFLSEIDTMIKQAEGRIAPLVDLPNYQKEVALTINASLFSCPDDFIAVEYLSLPGYGILEQKDAGFLREAYPSGETGRPRYFAMADDKNLLFGPAPDQSYTGSLQYMAKWPSLTDLKSGGETFISSRFPTALAHAALYYAALFRQDSETAASEKQEMIDSLDLLKGFGSGRAKKQTAEESNAAASPGDIK